MGLIKFSIRVTLLNIKFYKHLSSSMMSPSPFVFLFEFEPNAFNKNFKAHLVSSIMHTNTKIGSPICLWWGSRKIQEKSLLSCKPSKNIQMVKFCIFWTVFSVKMLHVESCGFSMKFNYSFHRTYQG